MRVLLDGCPVVLRPEDLLGEGGEARVFGVGARAVKVYRPPEEAASAERPVRERLLELARAKLARFPRDLPAAVVTPEALVYRPGETAPCGYAMARLDGAVALYHFTRARFGAGRLGTDDVVALFGRLHGLVASLHAAGVVVGDLSETNVVVEGLSGPGSGGLRLLPRLLDADSMQLGGLPCAVAQERTLDPHLYGVDLTARPSFTVESDWYAFAVLLVQCLLFVHPYGGTHPAHPTLLRRAEAGHSVLRGDVLCPKAARPAAALPEPLLSHLRAVFEGGRRGVFPLALLDMSWQTCVCGASWAGSACPGCARRRPRAVTPAVGHGRCRAVTLHDERQGRLLHAAYQGGLRLARTTGTGVAREDGAEIALEGAAWARVRASRRTTWVGFAGPEGGRVEAWRDGRSVLSAACDTWAGEAAFDANGESAFVVREGWLVEVASGRRFGQVLSGQTWLAVGETLGAGLYRAGRLTVGFVFETACPGLRPLALPALEGQVLELAASLDAAHVLPEVATERGGRREHALLVFDRDGALRAERRGAPESDPALAHVGGKAIVGDRVLYARDDGLGQLQVDAVGRVLLDGPCFPDAEPFVTSASHLIPGPGGSVYVAEAHRIVHLTLIQEKTP
jgi:hypothetical protein